MSSSPLCAPMRRSRKTRSKTVRPIASSAAGAVPASVTSASMRLEAQAQRLADVLLVVDDEHGELAHEVSLPRLSLRG